MNAAATQVFETKAKGTGKKLNASGLTDKEVNMADEKR